MTRSASEALKFTTFDWSFPAIVFDSCESIYCHFEEKTLIIEFLWIKFRLKSFLELHVHFNGFICIRMRKLQNARFKPMHVIEAKLCRHLVFQMSFRNIQRQKSYRNFRGDRSELWPSI